MKYTIQEQEDKTHKLLRHGEEVTFSAGSAPNNAELEFWLEIQRLRGLLRECWPCVWDCVYSCCPHRRPLLEKMDEFMGAENEYK